MPSLSIPKLTFELPHRSGPDVVGLDIQPGLVAAVRARVNGSILAQRAAALPLASDTVREGEVMDEGALADALRELFQGSRLSKRVRVGVANQRTVLRTLELPPVTDRKELAAAVLFQAQDQVPMALSNAVLDFHPLGIVDTPQGPRQRVALVAAQRDMIEHLLLAVRRAGLRPAGIDLSAFALIRSLYRPDPEHSGRVVYLNVDGVTNLAIAEGTLCRFTRVLGGGMEAMAVELAERGQMALPKARSLLSSVDLVADRPPGSAVTVPPLPAPPAQAPAGEAGPGTFVAAKDPREETLGADGPPAQVSPRTLLESGIRQIAGEVQKSLEFHTSQEGGGQVSLVVLSGSALDVPGFGEQLQSALGVEVRCEAVELADQSLAGTVSTHRLAVAAGLTATETPG